MEKGRKKSVGKKWIKSLAGAILFSGIAFQWCPPGYGMDALTYSELNQVSGKSGINIAFRDAVTVQASFRSLSQGDTDGWGGKAAVWAANPDDNPGWIVLIGTGSNSGYLRTTIPANAVLTVDVATTGASTCQVAGGAPYAGITVPPNTPFFSFSLTKTTIGLQTPYTVNVMMSNDATLAPGSMDIVGIMHAENLMINKADMKSTCYIWARP
ncbi:MAG: hypothetical protein AB1724_14370 [Thermodesulfobacteriota bacterium]